MEEFYSVIPPPGYEVPGMTTTYVVSSWRSDASLVERTRSLTSILGDEIAGLVNDLLVEAAIEARVGELLPLVGERIDPGKTGYLLRVNLVKEPTGGGIYAAPSLISALGPGTEPLDALAESYRVATLDGAQPSLPRERRYLWCTRTDESLSITCPTVALGAQLEVQARAEARRRQVLGAFTVTDPAAGLVRAQRAEFWQDFARERTQLLLKEADRLRVESLNRQFEASQQRFNEAYANYQTAQRELAANAREMATLSGISTIVNALSTGLAVRNQLSTRAPAPGSDAALRWHERQGEVLRNAAQKARGDLEFNLPRLRELDVRLRQEWSRLGAPAPQVEWVPPALM